jgi:IS5 family transposase
MDGQLSFATLDYAGKKKRTKRDVFLAEMAATVPWSVLEAVIAPHYPQQGPQGGRRAFPIAVMLRIYCLQQWYNLSDPSAEEALYDTSRCARSAIWNWDAIRSRMRRRS